MKSTESGIFFGNWLFSSVVEDDAPTKSYKYRLLVAITVLTGLFMWMYSVLSFFLVADKRLAAIGFTCAVIHAFCPMWYKITRSMTFSAYVLVAAGMTFQVSFAYFTGGFFAPTLIWIAVLPMIVAILTNKTHALVWIFICVSVYLVMFLARTRGLVPMNQLSEDGKVVVQFMVGLGLIALVGGFSLFFVELGYFYHNKVAAKSFQIRQLFRAITHDILNPLAALEAAHARIQKRIPELELELSHSRKIMANIRTTVENAGYFDAADSGRVVLSILPVSMNGLLESVAATFADRFREKNLTLDITEDVKSACVLGDETSLRTQVISNAISNAIKFSNPGSKIEVSGVSHDTEYEVIIRDYGVGIQPERLYQWEQAGALTSSVGTWGEKGTGFGLLLMKHYLDKAQGRLGIYSICDNTAPQNRGTRVSLFLKKAPAIG